MDTNFLRYNALDAACTLEIHNAIWEDLESGFSDTNKLTMDILPVLMFMQTRGIKISLELLEQTKIDVQRSIKEKQEELDKLCGRALNVNSPKDCQTYFYIELGIPPYYNDGRITIDDMALQRLVRGTVQRPGLRQAKLVQEIRGLQKLYGTYLNIEFDEDNRLRCSFNPRGTKFGRLSSSKTIFGTGTNFQNLPQDFKKFLVADDGFALLEIDKRQAEWVIVAYASGDANMISAIENGIDVHVHTASLMFNVEKEVIEYENKVVGHATSADMISTLRAEDNILSKFTRGFPRSMSARQCGKKSNHGLNYDEGPNGFALINEMDQAEAKRIVNLYHQIYPGIRIWYESIKRQLQRDRTLTNCFGRKVRFIGQWGDDLWKSAYSMLPQSTVVDSLNQGMVAIYGDELITLDWNVDILAQVHDSILMQVPIWLLKKEETFNHLCALLKSYTSPTITYNNRSFSIASDIKCGMNWGGANSNHNKNGMRDITCFNDMEDAFKIWEG